MLVIMTNRVTISAQLGYSTRMLLTGISNVKLRQFFGYGYMSFHFPFYISYSLLIYTEFKSYTLHKTSTTQTFLTAISLYCITKLYFSGLVDFSRTYLITNFAILLLSFRKSNNFCSVKVKIHDLYSLTNVIMNHHCFPLRIQLEQNK